MPIPAPSHSRPDALDSGPPPGNAPDVCGAVSGMISRLKRWALDLKRDVHALYLASRDPRLPWYAKVLVLAVAGYALSPIDLIPDFIPVLGQLDDLIIVPLGLLLVIRLVPADVMAEYRAIASGQTRPTSRIAAAAIVAIWIVSVAAAGWIGYQVWRRTSG
jgi:uncharacterized membrane protein YkvA (DUF1232 family)